MGSNFSHPSHRSPSHSCKAFKEQWALVQGERDLKNHCCEGECRRFHRHGTEENGVRGRPPPPHLWVSVAVHMLKRGLPPSQKLHWKITTGQAAGLSQLLTTELGGPQPLALAPRPVRGQRTCWLLAGLV